MSQEFQFSDPGEGLQEAEILEIHLKAGDTVSDGDAALTVETDKANTDIPAPFDGTVDEVRVSEGDTVQVGDVLMTYTAQGESSHTSAEEQEEQNKKQGEEPEAQQTQRTSDAADSQQAESAEAAGTSAGTEQRETSRGPVPAAPSTRRLAREQGVDLHEVQPSGPEGRVTAEDVQAHAQPGSEPSGSKQAASEKPASDQSGSSGSQPAGASSPLTPGLAPPELPDFSQWGEIERMPLRSIRKATARNMARSWSQIPHVYHEDIADVTELERFRREHEAEHGKLTLTVLVMKALAGLLQRYPRFNASLDVENREIVLKHYCHMGLAVDTDRGLLVPAIRDVDRKSVTELAEESANVAQQARDGELSRADMQGTSITVTNVGPLGGRSLSPLINHPQVAILGMGRAGLEPVVHGDLDDYEIVPRLRLPLILGFDHRVNDGADAARFVTELIEALADPEALLMAV